MGHNCRVPPDLTAEDLGRRRLHVGWIKLAFSIVIVVLAITEITLSEFDLGVRDVATAVGSWANELAPGLLILPFAVWFCPRLVLAWTAPLTWFIARGSVELPLVWQAVSVLCLFSLLWLLIRPVLSRRAGPRAQPGGFRPARQSNAISSTRPAWVALAVAAGIIAAVGGWAWQTWDGGLSRPSFTVGLAALVVPPIVFPSLIHLTSTHRRLQLMSRGATTRHVRVFEDAHDHHLLPVDATSRALVFTTLDEVMDDRPVSDFDGWLLARQKAQAEDEAQQDNSDAPPADDAQLGEWADAQFLEPVDDDEPEFHPEYEHWDLVSQRNGPAVSDPTDFTLIGQPVDGATVAIMGPNGRTWMGKLREAWLWDPPAVLTPSMDTTSASAVSDPQSNPHASPSRSSKEDDPRPKDMIRSMLGWLDLHVTARWAWPLFLVLLGGFALPYMLSLFPTEDPGARYIGLLVSLIVLFISCAEITTVVTLQPTRRGVWNRNLLLDRRLIPDRVSTIAAGQQSVALRETDRRNVILFSPSWIDSPLSTAEYAQSLREALGRTPRRSLVNRRPASALVAALLMILGWLMVLPPSFMT